MTESFRHCHTPSPKAETGGNSHLDDTLVWMRVKITDVIKLLALWRSKTYFSADKDLWHSAAVWDFILLFLGGGLLPPPPSVFPGFTSVLPAVSHWVPGYETQGDKWGGCTNNNYVLLKSESQSIVCPRARPSDSSACFSLPFSVCLQTLVVLSTCFNKYFVCCIPINIHREWSTLGFVIF